MENQLVDKSIIKLFFKFAIPSIVGILVNSLYIIVDGVFIGRGVGELGLASVNIDYPIICFNIAIGLLFGVGASILVAIKLGEENIEEAKSILGTAIFMMLLCGIFITILGILFLEPLMIFFGAEGEVLKLAKEYTIIMLIFTIPHILATGLNPIVRADGNPRLSMGILIVGAVINIFLDWLFVMKLHFGIKGAALATIIGITISSSYLLYYFFSFNTNIKIKLRDIKIHSRILKEICISGFVSFATEISLGIMYLVQNKLLILYGTIIDVSIFAIVAYISVIFVQILLGIAQGIQPIIGYNYGAKRLDKVKEILKIAIIINIVLGLLGFILCYVFRVQLSKVFGNNPKVIESSAKRLVIYLCSLPALGIVSTMASYYQSIKKDVYANIISISRWYLFLIPYSLILTKYIGADGIFIAQPASDYSALLVIFILVFLDKIRARKNRNIKRRDT